MGNVELIIKTLEDRGLLLVSKRQLLNLMIEVNQEAKVDARKKWLTQKQIIAKYNVSRYWLEKCEKDPDSRVRVIYGTGKTSKKKYNEQSIIEEFERLCL